MFNHLSGKDELEGLISEREILGGRKNRDFLTVSEIYSHNLGESHHFQHPGAAPHIQSR